MINRSVYGRTPEDSEMSGEYDLSDAPESLVPEDSYANATAILGEPTGETGEVAPGEAGPAGLAYASMGMVVQGFEGLTSLFPGIVPAEITLWLQQTIQTLPQMIQQMQSIGAGMPGAGMGMGMGQTSMLGQGQSQPPQPSGPPR